MPIISLFTFIGALAILICVVSLIALHLLPTGCNPVRDPVSNYAASSYGIFYRVQTTLSGIAALSLLALVVESGIPASTLGTLALLVYAIARLGITFLETDVTDTRTRTGTFHNIMAALAFAGIAIATVSLTPAFITIPPWSNLATPLYIAAWLTAISAVAFLVVIVVHRLHPVFGLVERGIYLGAFLWFAIVFGSLITL